MRQVLVGIVAITLLLVACKKERSDENVEANELTIYGRFVGTFVRSGMDTAQVSLLFRENNTFEGSSNRSRYPAICGGTFEATGDVLAVNDTCSWTADFDWTLIFDGSYNFSLSGDNDLRIWRSNGSITDEYRLAKVIR